MKIFMFLLLFSVVILQSEGFLNHEHIVASWTVEGMEYHLLDPTVQTSVDTMADFCKKKFKNGYVSSITTRSVLMEKHEVMLRKSLREEYFQILSKLPGTASVHVCQSPFSERILSKAKHNSNDRLSLLVLAGEVACLFLFFLFLLWILQFFICCTKSTRTGHRSTFSSLDLKV